ncbi:hypothetical protein OHA72_44380 [Dactylosporangium sp. NBC_01737]|uniref:hypothetical protein n=1 Tax=Dactylosporangium sp. NBC_01737 TaxID=2975959 RepID=UPI002E124580|nr:hypothetical protein OHA72_44380 [Dactylosporangium sp. NBC_01737]
MRRHPPHFRNFGPVLIAIFRAENDIRKSVMNAGNAESSAKFARMHPEIGVGLLCFEIGADLQGRDH